MDDGTIKTLPILVACRQGQWPFISMYQSLLIASLVFGNFTPETTENNY